MFKSSSGNNFEASGNAWSPRNGEQKANERSCRKAIEATHGAADGGTLELQMVNFHSLLTAAELEAIFQWGSSTPPSPDQQWNFSLDSDE